MKKSIVGVAGCERKNGDAIVIGKDYVAAVKQGEEIKDERATNHEQWLVKIRMRDNGRSIQVRADRAQWEKLRENDRVKVTYRVAQVSTPEPFGTRKFIEKRAHLNFSISFREVSEAVYARHLANEVRLCQRRFHIRFAQLLVRLRQSMGPR